MLTVTNLKFEYLRSRPLFDRLNFQLEQGKIYGLLGKNGAGKTTLLKLLSSLLYPTSGEIKFKGTDSTKRSPVYLKDIFLVPEEFSLPPVRINTYINLYAPFYENFDYRQLSGLISQFGLNANWKLDQMSYGQKKKFLLSFGLAANTSILLMDEPTNGLDIPSKSMFRKVCASALTPERIFIISTHQVKDVEGLIDQVSIIEEGKIILNKSIDEISSKIVMQKVSELPPETIFALETFGGWYAILPNEQGKASSQIDFELLFNATIDPEKKLIHYLSEGRERSERSEN